MFYGEDDMKKNHRGGSEHLPDLLQMWVKPPPHFHPKDYPGVVVLKDNLYWQHAIFECLISTCYKSLQGLFNRLLHMIAISLKHVILETESPGPIT